MTAEVVHPIPLFEHWGVLKLEDGLKLWMRAMLVYVSTDKGLSVSQQLRVLTVVVPQSDPRFKHAPPVGPLDRSGKPPAQIYDLIEVESPAES